MELRSASIIDTTTEGHYAFLPFANQISTRLHHHDFFEIFLVADGQIEHHINGIDERLTRGTLVFIRPQDTHCFRQYTGDECVLINLAFLERTFDALVTFLSINPDQLRTPTQPPTARLDGPARRALQGELQGWGRNAYGDKDQARQRLRALLATVISHHFVGDAVKEAAPLPSWIQELVREMQKPENFVEGRDALLRLANRTPAYVGRSMKAYLSVTPSQFINDLRLDYATDLLLQTDRSPTEIAFDVGFNNLSHFYHLFKERWGSSPNQYRNRHRWLSAP
jgi:AraC family cel operon transcriptional repressor